MHVDISREAGVTYYFCPIKYCNDYYFDYKLLLKHLKEMHPIILPQMRLDLILGYDLKNESEK